MKESYGSTVWNMLQEYAVWQPGDHTELGDYGLIKEGCFQRIGNIRNYITKPDTAVKVNQLEHISIRSESTVERSPLNKDEVRLSIEFNKNNGILLSAKDIEVSSFLELQKLGKLIALSAGWDKSWFVVTSLRKAGRFVLVISGDLKTTVEGPEKEVNAFMQGETEALSALSLAGTAALKLVGENGPLSVRLHRLKPRGNAFKHLDYNHAENDEWVLAPFLEGVPEY